VGVLFGLNAPFHTTKMSSEWYNFFKIVLTRGEQIFLNFLSVLRTPYSVLRRPLKDLEFGSDISGVRGGIKNYVHTVSLAPPYIYGVDA